MKVSKRSTPIRPSSSSVKSKDERLYQDNVHASIDTVELGYESGVDRYAQRNHMSGSTPHKRALRHYQHALNLKSQRSTHTPFYFHELAQDPPSQPPSTQVQSSINSRLPLRYKPTHFYPGGPDDGGALEAISPVGRTQFQRILPRYQYSTSETRESGLGPALEK